MFRYYCIMRPQMFGDLPTGANVRSVKLFSERRYIPEIDRMAWGWVECDEELTPQEVFDYELIMKPREE